VQVAFQNVVLIQQCIACMLHIFILNVYEMYLYIQPFKMSFK